MRPRAACLWELALPGRYATTVMKTFPWARPEATNSCPPMRSRVRLVMPGSINRPYA
jgi:hypothetical protein